MSPTFSHVLQCITCGIRAVADVCDRVPSATGSVAWALWPGSASGSLHSPALRIELLISSRLRHEVTAFTVISVLWCHGRNGHSRPAPPTIHHRRRVLHGQALFDNPAVSNSLRPFFPLPAVSIHEPAADAFVCLRSRFSIRALPAELIATSTRIECVPSNASLA